MTDPFMSPTAIPLHWQWAGALLAGMSTNERRNSASWLPSFEKLIPSASAELRSTARTDALNRHRAEAGGLVLAADRLWSKPTAAFSQALRDESEQTFQAAYRSCGSFSRFDRRITRPTMTMRNTTLVTTVPKPRPPFDVGCESRSPNDAPSGLVTI
jgi:hypothetical protein